MDSITDNITILYVEDDAIDAEDMEREFQKIKAPLSIIVAKNGVDALDKLLGKNGQNKINPAPKAILLDIRLPKMNGIEFLNSLRANPEFASTPVFIVTSTYSTEDKLAIRDMNVSGCLIKPVQHADVLNIYWCVTAGNDSAQLLF